jgi:hypothetical protein
MASQNAARAAGAETASDPRNVEQLGGRLDQQNKKAHRRTQEIIAAAITNSRVRTAIADALRRAVEHKSTNGGAG